MSRCRDVHGLLTENLPGDPAAPVAFLELVILCTALMVIVVGTVWIASDMRRTATLLRNVGQRTPRPLVVGLVLVGVLLLVFLVLRAFGAFA